MWTPPAGVCLRPRPMTAPPPRLYFAYSTILDPETLTRWKAEHSLPSFQLPEGQVAEAQDVDLVFNLHSPRWGGRIASLVQAPGRSVSGKLFRIPDADWATVRRAEGAQGGSFQEMPVRVKAGGQVVEAVAFASAADRTTLQGPVSESYASTLARGAEAAGLPRAYWERLKAEAQILQRVQAVGRELNLK